MKGTTTVNIVLLEPEIPENTGNIGRTCVAANAGLHLIRPFGFILNERGLKRAGMDYWDRLNVSDYVNYDDFIRRNKDARIWYATTKAGRTYADVRFEKDDFIMFGKESAGIPEDILRENRTRCIRIPMFDEERSLNLANSVAVILYEALRQNNFEGLKLHGKLTELSEGRSC